MSVANDALKGLVVMHKSRGIGIVSDVKDGRAIIDLGRPPALSLPKAGARKAETMILSHLNSQEQMTWKIPIDDFMDQPSWSMAPSKSRMSIILESLRAVPSNVVIPTNNPKQSALMKDSILESHRDFLSANSVSYDSNFINVLYQAVTTIDTQLSWFLLKGREGYTDYQDRIESMRDATPIDGWSEHIFSELPGSSQSRAIECLSAMALVSMHRDETTLEGAVKMIVDKVEERMGMYLNIISEFIRNRKSHTRRHSAA